MNVPFRKPSHEFRTLDQMKKVLRPKTNQFGMVIGHAIQLVYPEGHPMREYKDKKRALKQAKQAK